MAWNATIHRSGACIFPCSNARDTGMRGTINGILQSVACQLLMQLFSSLEVQKIRVHLPSAGALDYSK